MHKVTDLQTQLQANNREILKKLEKAAKDNIDDKVAESCYFARSRVEKVLEWYDKIKESIAFKLDSLLTNLDYNSYNSNNTISMLNNASSDSFMTCSCDGKFWDAPKCFAFPEKVTRKKA